MRRDADQHEAVRRRYSRHRAPDLISAQLLAIALAKCPSEDFLIPLNHLDSM
jgi:hypothetical protein